uniref:F-box protein 28 n=1 Tax=Suricata suricatta TaxID=37032 RepID=A0A673ST88_SURSU
MAAASEERMAEEGGGGHGDGGPSSAVGSAQRLPPPPPPPAPQPGSQVPPAPALAPDQLPQNNTLVALPIVAIENILSFMSYDEISQLRLVCKRMDLVCQRMLNQGFLKVERYHNLCQKQVKAQLPRRESERRNHSLARHADILAAVETRLSLLNMTFMKYVDSNLCCFIPGKVIDEIYRVLRYVNSTRAPQRAHEVLQELRDISSMAMEYFDEKIVPILKRKLPGSDVSGRLMGSPPGEVVTCCGTVAPLTRRRGRDWPRRGGTAGGGRPSSLPSQRLQLLVSVGLQRPPTRALLRFPLPAEADRRRGELAPLSSPELSRRARLGGERARLHVSKPGRGGAGPMERGQWSGRGRRAGRSKRG